MGKLRKRGLVYLLIAAMLLGFCGCTRHISSDNTINEQTDSTDEVLTSESEKAGQPSKEGTEPVSSEERTTADDNGSTTEDISEEDTENLTVESSDDNEDDTESDIKKETGTESDEGTDETTRNVINPTTVPTEAATKKPSVTEPSTTRPSATEPATTKPVQETTTAKSAVTTAAPTTEAATSPTTQAVSDEVTNLYTELASYSNISKEDIIKVRTIISSIITDDMNEIQKIKAVHDWLVKNTTYTVDYYSRSDAHNHLYNVLYNKIGVCQSYSVAFYVFMGELGIPCTFAVGSADNGSGSVSHAWNAVKLNNEWYFVDVTWDDPIVNGTSNYSDGYNMSYVYLLCTSSSMNRTHTANKYIKTEPTVLGTSTGYNELVYNMAGYKDVFRITTYDDLSTELMTVTESGTYIILLEGDDLDGQTAYNKMIEYLKTTNRGYSVEAILGGSSVSATITFE